MADGRQRDQAVYVRRPSQKVPDLAAQRLEVGWLIANLRMIEGRHVRDAIPGPNGAMRESSRYFEAEDRWRHWSQVRAGHMIGLTRRATTGSSDLAMRSKAKPTSGTRDNARGHRRGLERARPGIFIDARGYVATPADNLVADVHVDDFEADLRAGAGAELEDKFLAAHSSCALAVNCFAPFRQGRFPFDVGRHRNLRFVGFEQKFPIGLAHAEPPHLDVVAVGSSGLVAIELSAPNIFGHKSRNSRNATKQR